MSDPSQKKVDPYDPSTVPKGGLNKGAILLLKFSCPQGCVCKLAVQRIWHHQQCGNPSFITENGDILCKNHLKDCKGYFIKDAFFQCSKAAESNTWYQNKQMSKLLMALSSAIQAAENTLGDVDLEQFTQNLLEQVKSRWYT